MKHSIAVIALLLSTSACTLWWGASYNVVASSPDMIQYEYKLVSVSNISMNQAAQDHCEQFSKFPVREKAVRGGSEYLTTYRCLPFVGNVAPLN